VRFGNEVTTVYRDAIEEAAHAIIERGNQRHREIAQNVINSNVLITFVPLHEIGCSGVTGISSAWKTNKRITNQTLDLTEALSDVFIKFADWTFDVAGQRGCQGTLVHEGLHALDFARIISSFSRADRNPEQVYDLSLYELEHRAAVASAEYLVLVGEEDYIDDGLKLDLVSLDSDGKPFVDMAGINRRMQHGYGLNENEQGIMISRMLGLRPRGAFNWARFLGFSA
jgi:hypothetical protein